MKSEHYLKLGLSSLRGGQLLKSIYFSVTVSCSNCLGTLSN
jgi:hypothetical protein